MSAHHSVTFRAEFFEEDGHYVGLSPELNISSFGDSLDAAKLSLQQAVEALLEECEALGTLEDVMEEAGFERLGASWQPRSLIASELLSVR